MSWEMLNLVFWWLIGALAVAVATYPVARSVTGLPWVLLMWPVVAIIFAVKLLLWTFCFPGEEWD